MPHPEQEHALMIEVARLRHELKAAQASCVQEKARADAAEARAEKALAQRLVFDEALLREKEALAAARLECEDLRAKVMMHELARSLESSARAAPAAGEEGKR